MYRLSREQFVDPQFWGLWALMGFQAGFVNGFGFLACGRVVSHVTGFGTQIGVALGENTFLLAIELLGFPLSFIAGAFFNSLQTMARLESGKTPRFRAMTLALPIGFTAVLVAGVSGGFGPFDAQTSMTHEVLLLYVLSFFCGLQNGLFATLTHGQIRTTHLTGISTDIGTDTARLLFGKLKSQEHALTRNMNVCRILTFLSFASGSIAAVLMTKHFEYAAMIIPVLTSLFAYVVIQRVQRFLDAKFRTSLTPATAPTRTQTAPTTNAAPAP